MWSDTVLCTVSDIRSYRLSPEKLLEITKDANVDSAIQLKIDIAKDRIYDSLLLEVQDRVPMIASRWMNRKRGQTDYFAQEMRREFEILAKTTQIPIVPGVYDGSVIDLYMLLSMTQGLVPRTFSAPFAPVNGAMGTYVGQAYPGAVYIDTQADKMYYNTGTLNAPIWTRPNAYFVLDNILNINAGRINQFAIVDAGAGYALGDEGLITGGNGLARYVVIAETGGVPSALRISNAGVGYSKGTTTTTATTGSGSGLTINIKGFYKSALQRPAIEYTLWAMTEDGIDRNKTFDPDYMSYWSKRLKELEAQAKRTLLECVPLLDLDIDGDGVISDFEATLTHNPQGVFA